MSSWGDTPEKKPVIQVPDSSPVSRKDSPQYSHTRLFSKVKPTPLSGSSALREKFAFNGTNILGSSGNTAAALANRDIEILQGMFKSVSPRMVHAVYKTKANRDLKQAKSILTALVEKRKREEQMKLMQGRDSGTATTTTPTATTPAAVDRSVEVISSSAETSPQKSSKVVLNRSKKIAQKYGHALIDRELGPVEKSPEPEPKPKKRKLVRGSKNVSTVEIVSDNDVLELDSSKSKDPINLLEDDEDENDGKRQFFDDDDDDDVDESSLSAGNFTEIWNDKVVEFMNTAEDRDIADAAQCSITIAQEIISHRPYQSINHFESFNFSNDAKKKRKTDGEIFSGRANSLLRGYGAVDSLVAQCNSFSDVISQEIGKWGVRVHGVTDELEIVDVDIDDEFADDDDEGFARNKHSKVGYFKHKPKLLADNMELKNYQQVGLNWLNLLYRNKLSCILADEMGLGKTCQVIAFLAHLKETNPPDSPHLIVVPSSTLENWMREFNKFAPSLIVEPYYGSLKEREDIRYVLAQKWDKIDVLVTTYTLAAGTKDDVHFLKSGNFNVIVYDEGHMLKNSTSERFQKLMKLRARFRLLLTGTPLQNNLRELMSLLEFILPSIFVSKKEDLKYVFHQKATTKDQDFNPLLSQRAISNAKKMMAPFILRRRKDQVLQHLPPKYNRVEYCDLTEDQEQVYQEKLNYVMKLRSDKNSKMTNALMLLRKAAIHPMLFRHHYDDETLKIMSKEIMKEPVYCDANLQYIYEDMEVMTDFELHNLCVKFPSISSFQLDESYFMKSGKIKVLQRLLEEIISKKDKVLIFSMFTQVLDILERVLSILSIKFMRFDGSTPVDMRQDLIDKFYEEEGIPVFLLSTRAGGFGINLVCANHVIIFDQSFNPHDDKQAEDRAHRVGQERAVDVIRLITKDTIEESMYSLAQNKLELDMSMSGEQIENKAAAIVGNMVFDDIRSKGEVKKQFNEIQEIDSRETSEPLSVTEGDAKQEVKSEVIVEEDGQKGDEPILIE